jgi:hypothetical protein
MITRMATQLLAYCPRNDPTPRTRNSKTSSHGTPAHQNRVFVDERAVEEWLRGSRHCDLGSRCDQHPHGRGRKDLPIRSHIAKEAQIELGTGHGGTLTLIVGISSYGRRDAGTGNLFFSDDRLHGNGAHQTLKKAELAPMIRHRGLGPAGNAPHDARVNAVRAREQATCQRTFKKNR